MRVCAENHNVSYHWYNGIFCLYDSFEIEIKPIYIIIIYVIDYGNYSNLFAFKVSSLRIICIKYNCQNNKGNYETFYFHY